MNILNTEIPNEVVEKPKQSKLLFQKVDLRELLPSYEVLDEIKNKYFYNASDIVLYGELLPKEKTWHVFAIRVVFSSTDFPFCPMTFEMVHWHSSSNSSIIHMSNDLKTFLSEWNISCVQIIGKMSIRECIEQFSTNLMRGCPLYGCKSEDNIWEGLVLIGKNVFVKVLNSQHNYSKDQLKLVHTDQQEKIKQDVIDMFIKIIDTPKIKQIKTPKEKTTNDKKDKMDQDFESAWSKFTDPTEAMLVEEMMNDNESSQRKNIQNYVKWRLSKTTK